jgi:hypothetical protein
MAITLSTAAAEAARPAACNAIVDLVDVSGPGDIQLTLADGTTQVAQCVFQNPAFGNASAAGVATQNGTAVDTAADGNVAAVTIFHARNGLGATIWSGTVAESGADLNIDDGTPGGGVIIEPNAVVTLSSISFTVSIA